MAQNNAEAGALFDGFTAVGAIDASEVDSIDEIESLTDDEAFDVNAYLPKNGKKMSLNIPIIIITLLI